MASGRCSSGTYEMIFTFSRNCSREDAESWTVARTLLRASLASGATSGSSHDGHGFSAGEVLEGLAGVLEGLVVLMRFSLSGETSGGGC